VLFNVSMSERRRLEEARAGKKWRRWGTYLSERQWGTVREDYSADGDAWSYFSHEDAAARAYRWGDDGLLGLSDNRGLLNFAVALWNEEDELLKERLFGLSGAEGNHGEDVKELYFYLDATPTHSYAKALYKYPQRRFPYQELRDAAKSAGRDVPETELWDLGILAGDAYFDVYVEYAKADIEDVLIRITVVNRGRETRPIHLLPTAWFRNTWSWQKGTPPDGALWADGDGIAIDHSHLGPRWLHIEESDELLFTENETNFHKLYGTKNTAPFTKDAFFRHVVLGEKGAVNPEQRGSKAAAHVTWRLAPGESRVLQLRLTDARKKAPFRDFDGVFAARIADADAFYEPMLPRDARPEARAVFRQAMAGLLWTKQYYFFDVDRWLRGDPAFPEPPRDRFEGRDRHWRHLYNSEVLSVPDKWEYPWYAAWDLAFHCLPLAMIDPEFAKLQLTLLLREWYMHPNGQLPAYEWSFGDVNPPVHAWAALRVHQIDRRMSGQADRGFLETVFHKLMLNFTWWVNRKDTSGKNVFEGGFLGLDNIGVFDRSSALPEGGTLEQADATSWMGMYCLNLLRMAMELARDNPSYQDMANKYLEHFLYIAHAINGEVSLWDEDDGFFYDVLRLPNGDTVPLKVRSMVGLIPLFAVDTLEAEVMDRCPAFVKRMRWFVENRPELGAQIGELKASGAHEHHLLSLLSRERLVRVLARMLDENEFLSPYGIRALSRVHRDHPYKVALDGILHEVAYDPAESRSGIFGGNSNWRGPVWFPVNYLIIEALQKYHHFYQDDLKVECPTGSGKMMNLWEVSAELSRRLVSLFVRDKGGRRPADARLGDLQDSPHFADHVTFWEYFHGDTGEGLGASHQTGWTALVAKLIEQSPLWSGGKRHRVSERA
jgi:hypothetical protein